MSDNLIEAMANKLRERGHLLTDDQISATLNALRETLVPVGWVYAQEGEQSLTSPWRVKAEGWTETPLFALPEIDNG